MRCWPLAILVVIHGCTAGDAAGTTTDAWLGRYERFWTESLERLDFFLREEEKAKMRDGKRSQGQDADSGS